MKSSPFENPYILATQIGSWLHNWKMPPKGRRDYAEAPEVRNISKGERLFRTRCSACHTIGVKDVAAAEKAALGPDLLGVTQKRDRAWLIRWMAEPDKMLAEKDPLAMALLAEYNNVRDAQSAAERRRDPGPAHLYRGREPQSGTRAAPTRGIGPE